MTCRFCFSLNALSLVSANYCYGSCTLACIPCSEKLVRQRDILSFAVEVSVGLVIRVISALAAAPERRLKTVSFRPRCAGMHGPAPARPACSAPLLRRWLAGGLMGDARCTLSLTRLAGMISHLTSQFESSSAGPPGMVPLAYFLDVSPVASWLDANFLIL